MTDDRSKALLFCPVAMKHRGLLIELAFAIVFFLCVFGPSLYSHMSNSADPNQFNDDSRQQIWPFLRYYDSALFQDDYIATYYLDCLPIGYKGLYRSWSTIGDPRVLSKVIPYLLLLVVLVSVGVTSRKLGGRIAGWGAVALCLSSSYFLGRMSGGLPRSFALPLLAVTAMALTLDRPMLIALTACLGAAFYPPVGVVCGLVLAVYLLLLRVGNCRGGEDWSFKKRFAVVLITAGLCVLILLPPMIGSQSYGPQIDENHLADYPEAGPNGRYDPKDGAPYDPFVTESDLVIKQTLISRIGAYGGRPKPWWKISAWVHGENRQITSLEYNLIIMLLCLGGAGTIVLSIQYSAAQRLLLLLLVAVIAHAVSVMVAPKLFVPTRYVDYPVPILVVILIPAGAGALGWLLAKWCKQVWLKSAMVLIVCVVAVVGLGSRGDSRAGLTIRSDQDPHPFEKIYEFLSSLPSDVLIAGWPAGQLVNNVPYVCQRSALVTYETHQAFHKQYVLEMRRRTSALIEAYFATDPAALIYLHEEFGVTHLVIDVRHLKNPEGYFAPFHLHIKQVLQGIENRRFEMEKQKDHALVLMQWPFAVLDLSRIR